MKQPAIVEKAQQEGITVSKESNVDTTLMAESEELKSFLMKVKEESEKVRVLKIFNSSIES